MDAQRNGAGREAGQDSPLVGAGALVLVAQPWNFQSLHGRGRLVGCICADIAFGNSGRELRLAIRRQVIHPGRGELDLLRVLPLHTGGGISAERLSRGESAGVRLYALRGGEPPLVGALRLQI